LIGSDIPSVEPRHIAKGFRLLGQNDVVFGPAEDGGYWLVGMSRRRPLAKPFDGVGWSGDQTLADNLSILSNKKITLADKLHDIDTLEDYQRAAIWAGRLVLPV